MEGAQDLARPLSWKPLGAMPRRESAIRRRVLIVEDSPGDVELTIERLTAATSPFFEVASAGTLAQAMLLLSRERVDAVILDLNLPDSDGVETVSRIMPLCRDTAVIVLTGSLDGRVRESAVMAGVDEVCTKEEANTRLFWRVVVQVIERRREQQRQLQALLDTTPDAILVVNAQGLVRYCNQAALALFGRSREELMGESMGFSVRDIEPSEITIRGADGSHVCEMRVVPFTWNEERAYLASIRDITLRRQADQIQARAAELERENRHIVESARIKSEFLANMSHELRTPLNAIIGFSELLLDATVEPGRDTQQKYVGHILSSGRHLLQLINDVLDMAQVEAGKIRLRPQKVELPALIGEVVAVCGSLAVRRRVRIMIHHHDAVREAVLDPVRFKQMLYNYLSNALKFTPENSTVTVRTRPEGTSGFVVEVQDQGPGIAPADIGRLFQQFQQLDTGGGRQQGGTGLGLALTKRLAEAQGGSVGVSSVLGGGSVFHVTLPIAPADAPTAGD